MWATWHQLWKMCLLAAFLAASSNVFAHNAPNSAVELEFLPNAVEARLTLPLNELELGFKQPLLVDPTSTWSRHGPALRNYVLEHMALESPEGQKWSIELLEAAKPPFIAPAMQDEPGSVPDLVLHLRMTPPGGASTRKFTLRYDVIGHEVNNHQAIVSVLHDWNTASFGRDKEILGILQFTVKTLAVDREGGSWWKGFYSIFRSGMSHIAEGLDHLLFLLVLLLPAPLLSAGKCWGGYAGWKKTLLQVLKTVTAFTVGHSATLGLSILGWVHLPTRPVEVVIALSILASALHAWRPIFRGRELWIAAGFGLIHGLAFAELLSGYGITNGYLLAGLTAFNLGIEAQQLLIVACALPVLILLARSRWEKPLRLAAAAGAACMAAWWMWERLAQ